MPIKNYTTKIDVFESLGEIQGALARAKNNGIREGIDAVCEAMALAHYNAAIELEIDEREVGAFYTRMRHAIAVAYEKMGVEPM